MGVYSFLVKYLNKNLTDEINNTINTMYAK